VCRTSPSHDRLLMQAVYSKRVLCMYWYVDVCWIPFFPTRRSSDLGRRDWFWWFLGLNIYFRGVRGHILRKAQKRPHSNNRWYIRDASVGNASHLALLWGVRSGSSCKFSTFWVAFSPVWGQHRLRIG